MIRTYIASAYTGNVDDNCAAAMDAAELVAAEGFLPFLPHLYRAWGDRHAHGYEFWMRLCFEEVGRSDTLLRLPGHSPGADREVAHAIALGKPVFHSIADLVAWRDAPLVADALLPLRRAIEDARANYQRAIAEGMPPDILDAQREQVQIARTEPRLAVRG